MLSSILKENFNFQRLLGEHYFAVLHITNLSKIRRLAIHLLLGLLLLFGLYFPTSVNGNISVLLSSSAEIIIALICFLLLVLCDFGGLGALFCGLFIAFSMIFFTLFSPLPEYAFGAVPSFLTLSLLYCLNLRSVGWSKGLMMLFWAVNLLNLVAVIAIIINFQPVNNFLSTWYAAFYPELIGNMLRQNKPVLSFATHSIAGLMLFFFFYLNMKTYRTTKRRVYLVFSAGYLVACWRLSSVMGYFSSMLAVGYALYSFLPRTRHQLGRLILLVIPLILLTLLTLCILYYKPIVKKTEAVAQLVEQKLMSPTNGFKGRYSAEGVQGVNLKYIASHPFQPTGFRTDGELYFTDSGPVEYFLRGSLLLFAAIYTGLYFFLRNNLRSGATAYFLFTLFVLAELGFPYLKYFRFQSMLVFAVVYLNHLDRLPVELS